VQLTVTFALGTGVGLLRTHRSEEPDEDVRYEKGKGTAKTTCVKLDQIIWLIDESPYECERGMLLTNTAKGNLITW
jgi:hypothetical protein